MCESERETRRTRGGSIALRGLGGCQGLEQGDKDQRPHLTPAQGCQSLRRAVRASAGMSEPPQGCESHSRDVRATQRPLNLSLSWKGESRHRLRDLVILALFVPKTQGLRQTDSGQEGAVISFFIPSGLKVLGIHCWGSQRPGSRLLLHQVKPINAQFTCTFPDIWRFYPSVRSGKFCGFASAFFLSQT